jgi:hypothetical protein
VKGRGDYPRACISVLLDFARSGLPCFPKGKERGADPEVLFRAVPALSNGAFTWAASFECRLASYRRSGCTSHTRERYERWAGLLRSVAVISVNCSASSSRPGSVRSVSGTGQAVLVSSIRVADAACNVTPIVVRRWFARGWLPQPPRTLPQIHEVRDNDAGRRLRGRGAAHGTDTRWTQGCNCGLCCKAKLTL